MYHKKNRKRANKVRGARYHGTNGHKDVKDVRGVYGYCACRSRAPIYKARGLYFYICQKCGMISDKFSSIEKLREWSVNNS